MQTKPFRYGTCKTEQISFPLGGLGTGCIGLSGNGRLIDWEIFNRPNKSSVNGFSHFGVRVESQGRLVDARVLQGDLPPPYEGNHKGTYAGIGFGPARETLAGLPHFAKVDFRATYPVASLVFRDPQFPGRVELTAFNPFIPLNARESGLPAACFEFAITNGTRRPLTYAIGGTLANPLPAPNVNGLRRLGRFRGMHVRTGGLAAGDPGYGDLCLATDGADVSAQAYWYRGAWFDALEIFWRDFTTVGPIPPRRYTRREAGQGTHATLLARVRVPAGATRRVRFVITWNYPNRVNDWDAKATERAAAAGLSPSWRNWYATQWRDAAASARYMLTHWDRLAGETHAFRDALLASTLPAAMLDAVTANLSILKSPTVMRLEDGTFYGFEGCHAQAGCCEGTCTHVWNYAQALPFLFPELERSVREADFRYNQQANGGMPFRLPLPLGIHSADGRSCADGLFGNVLMVYRDWRISGDDGWLRRMWPSVQKALAFAWDPSNADRWDPERTGVLWGRQHHTLDMELFGPSAWLCGFYLGALKAGAAMAGQLGEADQAAAYAALFAAGRRWVDGHLFNGEYYQQRVDLGDRRLVARFGAAGAYWDREHGEIKYQMGEGCAIDQVLAQWHANLYGLGDLFDPAQVRSSLRAIYRHNFKRRLRGHANTCRLYGLNDEAGTVICEWPAGRRRPAIPVPYAQETMHGFEYAAAGHLIQNGLWREGLAMVQAVRDRYDGEKRNPWNEIECGSNYARSMASYALLHACSGFTFDMGRGRIGFAPARGTTLPFRCFWCLETGWGWVEWRERGLTVGVSRGGLRLQELRLAGLTGRAVRSVLAGRRRLTFTETRESLVFGRQVQIEPGRPLRVQWR
ncbi:MAG: hypothetical protein K8T26_12600 [Lentisphaerae bacterium]|nr:hypothetical protein [Lentisphaerota bacterium]